MEEEKKSDLDKFIVSQAKGFAGQVKVLGVFFGLFITYQSYNNIFKVGDFTKFALIVAGLLTTVLSFYSLLKKK